MPLFELSITTDYAPSWGLWEGIREIIQNAMDGHDEGYDMEVEHDGEALRITNRGLKLDTSVWLLGKSSKRYNDASRGQHGDGLKVGVLALIREDIPVWIMNGPERWTPQFVSSEHYAGEQVLAINTRKGSKRDSDFSVYVKIPYVTWINMKRRFLPLTNIDPEAMETVQRKGSIIFDKTFAGDVYVKGIWVCRKPDLPFGYDLLNLQLDRDRRLVDDYDLAYETSNIWCGLLDKCTAEHTFFQETFDRILTGNAIDLRKVYYHSTTNITSNFVEIFKDRYGKNARPVDNAEMATKLEFYGLKGVVVPTALGEVLASHFGSFEDMIRKAIQTSGAFIPRVELTEVERHNFDAALNLLFLADVGNMDYLTNIIKPFEFVGDDAPMGLWVKGVEIRINRKALQSMSKTLGIMIHEIAHDAGRDGTLGHRSKQESIWEKVSEVMFEMVGTDWLN